MLLLQLQLFRNLLDDQGGKLTNNFRAIQPLGDREVLYNTNSVEETPKEAKAANGLKILLQIEKLLSALLGNLKRKI